MSRTRPASRRHCPSIISRSPAGVRALGTAVALSLGLGCGAKDNAPSAPPTNQPVTNMMPGDDPTAPNGDSPPVLPSNGSDAAPLDREMEGMVDVGGLVTPVGAGGSGSEEPPVEEPPVEEPPVEEPGECTPIQNPGSLDDGDINVNLATEFQTISGFGGMNMPRWIGDLTPAQANTAFGDAPGQLGLSILRIGISQNPGDFARELPTAQRVAALGAKIIATPWTPPANLKTNGNIVGGELQRANYGAYADHLMGFVNFMSDGGVPIEAVSIQNEPDIEVDYDSCDWTPQQLIDFLIEQGPRFGDVRIMAPESFNFNRQRTDPLLNDPRSAQQFEIVAGHVYGSGLADYPLARQRGKEVWMTEHFTDTDEANLWPSALDVGVELNASMKANFNAYIWWYIRRVYGLISENGQVSKRGYLMSQYARFIRPGFVRVAASDGGAPAGVQVTAYKSGPGQVVIVALNTSAQPRNVALDVFGSCVTSFARFTTSATKNALDDGLVALDDGRAAVTLDAQSLTTFVSQEVEQ